MAKTFFIRIIALLLGLLPPTLSAQELVPLTIDDSALWLELPDPDAAEMRILSQLMWDPAERSLRRQQIEVIDLFPGAGLSLTWKPRSDGAGRLIWRKPGAASYDMSQVAALYDGAVQDGRPHGIGTLWLRSGAGYRGEWRDGEMTGQGHLRWPDGREFAGALVRGLPDGEGRLTDTGGTVYAGTFRTGRRDGLHQVFPPDGRSYHTLWSEGREAAGGRDPVPGPGGVVHVVPVQQRQHDDARVGVGVNQTLPPDVYPGTIMLYDSYSEGGVLKVYPGGDGFMERWRGLQPLWVSSIWGETQDFAYGLHQPASFDLSFENSGARPLYVVGGYLAVRESWPDLDPAMEVAIDSEGCPKPPIYTKFRFKNYGWSQPIDAQIRGAFVRPAGGPASPEFTAPVRDGWPQATIDFAGGLQQIGVDVGRLSRVQNCPSRDFFGCTEALRRSGTFGQVAEAIFVSTDMSGDAFIGADFVGSLDYVWRDARGTAHRKSSPVRLPVRLASFEGINTCAEGGDEIFEYPNPFLLRTDGQNYHLPFPIDAAVAPGMISRWSFQIDAAAASRHLFQIVLQLADGREVASRPVDLTYFKLADIWQY